MFRYPKSWKVDFIEFQVEEIMNSPGKVLMDKFSEMKEKKAFLDSIMYMYNDSRHSINVNVFITQYHGNFRDPEDRLIYGIHPDLGLDSDEIDLSWNNSNAILKKISSLPEKIVLTENGEEIVY